MRKRNSLDDILNSITPEELVKWEKQRLEYRSKLSLAYQLGIYVGEQIVDKHLVTLSCDMLQTRKNISVTCGEGDECRRLNAVWFNKVMSIKGNDEKAKHKATEAEWKALRDYHEMLEAKYLPNTIECNFNLLNITEKDMDDFKKGIGDSLWDCDCSHYSTRPEDIDVKADEDGYYTTITLKRD